MVPFAWFVRLILEGTKMAEKHEIILTIAPDGSFTSEVKGVKGPRCSDLTKWVKSLGIVTEDKSTDDFFKQDGQGITTGF